MTYKDFKKHFQDRAIKEYGFKRVGSRIYYTNEEVLIVFDIVKSAYSNSLSRFALGVNPFELSEKWKRIDPIIYEGSHFGIDIDDERYVDLDKIDDYEEYDKIFDNFFKKTFPKLTTVDGIKEMIKADDLYAWDHIREFWNLKQNTK